MTGDFDFAVVGSGPTGTTAAQTLVESGAKVLMLDGGRRDERYGNAVPPENFVDLRKTDENQYRYLLGERFESAVYRRLAAGAQLTPPRRYAVEGAAGFAPLRADGFAPMESLAYGGLGSAWGLLCAAFSDAELELASLPATDMHDAYQTVADRIGISGAAGDDAQPYTYAALSGIQPPVPLDPTAAVLSERYAARRASLQTRGFHAGRPALALLTQDKDERRATRLRDMDFYDDAEGAAWRPALALDVLRRSPNFAYEGGLLVTRFEETDDAVRVTALDLAAGTTRTFAARKLVLCSGVLGTARIVLRSLASATQDLPLLCNPYTYVPCVVPRRIGQDMPHENIGLVQLLLFHDPDALHRDVAVGTIFSYRALMLFRLLRETPLGVYHARLLLNYLLSGLLIVGIDHPQGPSAGKCVRLERDDGSPTRDALRVEFELSDGERRACDARERTFLRVLRELGAWPIKRVRPPLGSSIHYAGTLPFAQRERPFALDPNGRLHGTRAIYVADGSGFTFLPAKGVTFSLMANAHRIAKRLAAHG